MRPSSRKRAKAERSLQAVVHYLRERDLRGELSAFLTQPFFEIVDERFGSLAADSETALGVKSSMANSSSCIAGAANSDPTSSQPPAPYRLVLERAR
jgi:hypothetical protein